MQNVMRVYYDDKGNIKDLKHLRAIASSHNVDLIEIYCDFDISRYQANISFTRADGMTLGPYPLLPKTDENGKTYHTYLLESRETEIAGALQCTPRFEIYELDEEIGDYVVTYSKPCGMFTITVYDAVITAENDYQTYTQAEIDQMFRALSVRLEKKVEEIENTVGLVEGLLDENDKIRASLLPSFVFGSMRFVTTWGDTENNTLEHLHTNVIAPYITSNGGSSRGCYVIVTRTMQVSVSNGYSLYMDETEGVSDPLPISVGQITIERGDWLICISDDGKTWGVINNVYRDATIVNKGIVQLAKEEDGINGTSTTLAMTPKATVAAINAAINEILGDIDTALSNILGV
jgi:hypothetical protein